MNTIATIIGDTRSIGIGGHVRPDGDAVGSCMGLYLYLKTWYPDRDVQVYLESPGEIFSYISRFDEIRTAPLADKVYDLFITLDVSSRDRLGVAGPCYDKALRTACIDHHISNPLFADINVVEGEASSACEVLYTLLEPEKVTREIAIPLYTGIVHDTGVFMYTSTSPRTMRIAAALMETGFNFNRIIDESFYQKTYVQNQIIGRVLTESILLMNEKVIVGTLRYKDFDFYGITPGDLDGVVSQLRQTAGTEVAVFAYEISPMYYKVSLRCNGDVDAARAAVFFGGGGHKKAAGFEMPGTFHDVINNLTAQLEIQFNELGL